MVSFLKKLEFTIKNMFTFPTMCKLEYLIQSVFELKQKNSNSISHSYNNNNIYNNNNNSIKKSIVL